MGLQVGSTGLELRQVGETHGPDQPAVARELQRLRAELDSVWEPALLALKQATEASDRP
jgi:hypothetical protein